MSNKKYVQKFRKSWLDRDELREWLVENPNQENKKYGGYCVYCNTALPSKLYDLQSHAASRKHAKNVSDQTRIEVKVEKTEDILAEACRMLHTKQLATESEEDSKEDQLGQYIANQLKQIKSKKIYEEVKWDIIQTLQNALINQPSDLEENEA